MSLAPNILILENEVIVAYDLKEMLEQQGYCTHLAHDIETARTILALHDIHILFFDTNIVSPSDSMQFIQQILNLFPALTVIFATAEQAAITHPSVYRLSKPWNVDQLSILLKKALS